MPELSTGDIVERIVGKLAWPPTDDITFCWVWDGQVGARGNPQLGFSKTTISPGRLLYEAEHGCRLPRGRKLRRTCGNLLCVSPHHASVDRS